MHIDETKKFDKRNIQRNLKDGLVSQKDYESYLSKLPDASDKVFVADTEPAETEHKGIAEGSSHKGSAKKKTKGK
jgi:hypothetical protein